MESGSCSSSTLYLPSSTIAIDVMMKGMTNMMTPPAIPPKMAPIMMDTRDRPLAGGVGDIIEGTVLKEDGLETKE